MFQHLLQFLRGVLVAGVPKFYIAWNEKGTTNRSNRYGQTYAVT